MKLLVLLAITAVFFSVFTRAEDEDEEYEEEEYEDEPADGRLFASAMQLNNNNVGDIHNVKVNFDGELHNKMSADIITILAQLIGEGGLFGDGDDDGDDDYDGDDDESEEYPSEEEPDIEECPEEGIKFISHPEDCEQYILCIDGDEVATLSCPDDLHFSRELRSCTDPDEAECE